MKSTLYDKMNYLTPQRFIKSVTITEYDMSKANICTLFEAGKLTAEQFAYLSRLPKYDRERDIGLMIERDGKIYNTIHDGIVRAKEKLFSMNNIQDYEVIRIANDAVYVMRNTPLEYTTFGLADFKIKSQYTTFIRLGGISIFFRSCPDGELDLDVIDLGKTNIPLHADYMLTFIANVLCLLESAPIDATIQFFNSFYIRYLNRDLDIGNYRELNERSTFVVQTKNEKFGMGFVDQKDVDKIDISYNAGILRELYSVIASSYQYK